MKNNTETSVTVEATETPKKDERRVQITIKQLKELAADQPLLNEFIRTIHNNPDMKSPIAWQFAKAILKQTEMIIE